MWRMCDGLKSLMPFYIHIHRYFKLQTTHQHWLSYENGFIFPKLYFSYAWNSFPVSDHDLRPEEGSGQKAKNQRPIFLTKLNSLFAYAYYKAI